MVTMSTSDAASDRWQAPSFPDAGNGMLTAGDLERLQQQAYEEAYTEAWQKGLEEGREQGLAEARDELRERSELLRGLLGHLAAPLEALDDALEAQLARMVSVMVGRLFRRELAQDPESIVGLVRDAVSLLPMSARQIEVHLHPDDAERLEAIYAMRDDNDAGQRFQVVRDASLMRGGCRIKSESSHIDARVESRIDAMINTLMGDQRG